MYGAIDVGGTKTLIAVFDDTQNKVAEQKFATPKLYDDFVGELASQSSSLPQKNFKRIVAALPGKIDRKHGRGIAFGNLPWENISAQRDIERIFHAPTSLENDANLAGLSEALLVRKKYRKVVYITVSTGIGGVMIVDGKIDENTQDAEFGHMLLEHKGALRRWQEFASGKAIVARTGKKASDIPKDDTLWYGIARNIAIGLIDVVANLTPDAVIFGGGVGSHFDKFKGHLNEQMKIYDNPMISLPVLLGAKRAEEAVIYGCYDYAKSLE